MKTANCKLKSEKKREPESGKKDRRGSYLRSRWNAFIRLSANAKGT